MDSNKRTAVTTGVLFIIATVASVLGTQISRPILNDPDYLASISANATTVEGGALLELIAAGARAGIAISFYPIVSRLWAWGRWSSGPSRPSCA